MQAHQDCKTFQKVGWIDISDALLDWPYLALPVEFWPSVSQRRPEFQICLQILILFTNFIYNIEAPPWVN